MLELFYGLVVDAIYRVQCLIEAIARMSGVVHLSAVRLLNSARESEPDQPLIRGLKSRVSRLKVASYESLGLF